MRSLLESLPVLPAFGRAFSQTSFRHCVTWEGMEDFNLDTVNLAILQRCVPDCKQALSELQYRDPRCFDLSVQKGARPGFVEAQLEALLGLRAQDRFVLYEDIASLAARFFRLTGASRIHIHLHKVCSDSCQFFHVDKVEARLLATYVGAGTQWLKEEDVNRRALGKQNNSRVLRSGAEVQSLLPGWVGIFKGERNNSGAGVVHRSPPMGRNALPRILLKIDLKS